MLKVVDWVDKHLKSTKTMTAGEDIADSFALIIICGLLLIVVFI